MKRIAPLLPVPILVATLAVTIAASYFSRDLPEETSTLFAGSGQCATCHQSNGVALVNAAGEDVAPPNDWRATMMANAARDPVWRAKVSAEIDENPSLKSVIEDKCITCHAPAGRTEALFHGAENYSIEEMLADPLAMDGVTCTVCHQIKDVNMGTDSSYSGQFTIENDHIIYGPFDNMLTGPMQTLSGYRPEFSAHTSTSEMCATCHTLFTPFLDNNGEIAGELPEQTPYLEWRNSVFNEQDVSCQSCHMPRLKEPVQITNFPNRAPQHSPFGQHHFVGANVTILKLMQANIDSLGITASEVNFDSTIARTLRQLQYATIDLSGSYSWADDSLQIDVGVRNLAGHKFPTGYPSRRAWIHLTVRDGLDNIVFESGKWDPETIKLGIQNYEPHRQVINREDQVQIYQSVMADVDGEVTWTLLRGAEYIKDNRIPPEGFTRAHPDYEHTPIRGKALDDADFNHDANGEGSGADVIIYKVGQLPMGSPFTAEIELLYQSLSPGFIDDLLAHETEEVATFSAYWDEADQSPISMETIVVSSSSTAQTNETPSVSFNLSPNFPNPFAKSTQFSFELSESSLVDISVVDVSGRVIRRFVSEFRAAGDYRIAWDGADQAGQSVPAGTYFVRLVTPRGTEVITITKLGT